MWVMAYITVEPPNTAPLLPASLNTTANFEVPNMFLTSNNM